MAAWTALKPGLEEWLTTNDQVFGLYRQWENTFILNPSLLWGSMQRYQGDHYFLLRRLAEMLTTGQVSGAEVTTADNLCAFGQWRESFNAGRELFSQNHKIRANMDEIRDPHHTFHAKAGATPGGGRPSLRNCSAWPTRWWAIFQG